MQILGFLVLTLTATFPCEKTALKKEIKTNFMHGLSMVSACSDDPRTPEDVAKWSKVLLLKNEKHIRQKARAWVMEIYLAQISYRAEMGREPTLSDLVKAKYLPKPSPGLSYFFHPLVLGKGRKQVIYLEGRHFPVFGEFIEVSKKSLPKRKDR